MTGVRRLSRPNRLTFISRGRKETRKARLSNNRLGEDSRGGRFRPICPNHVFSRLRRKPIAPQLAVGLRSGPTSRCVGQSPPPKQHMEIAATDETGQSQSHMITLAHRSLQVTVRSLRGSSEGEGGTPLPLGTPLDRVYSIVGNHGGPLVHPAKGVVSSGR